ncbi:hypothetical protein BDZ89DRAFT_1107063 [Hymenopellis radicata]|nr:hypothetical protein BDZ89DRAFT_1107063 [Hymenopellis radicata]
MDSAQPRTVTTSRPLNSRTRPESYMFSKSPSGGEDERLGLKVPTPPLRGVSLRNFASSTGTYRWPRLESSILDKHTPNYRPSGHDDDNSSNSSVASSSPISRERELITLPPLRIPPSPTDQSSVATLVEPMRRTSIADIHFIRPHSDAVHSDFVARSPSPRARPTNSLLTGGSAVSSPSRLLPQMRRSDSPPMHREVTPPVASPSATTTHDSDDKNGWLKHAEKSFDKSYKCLWRNGTGMTSQCLYRGNRQLMKRHVETVHMKILRYSCEYCNARFPQKTNVQVHMSSQHTGVRTSLCPYEQCGRDFNDPAALHRHKVSVHGHVPRPTKRQKKLAETSSEHESMAPWNPQN